MPIFALIESSLEIRGQGKEQSTDIVLSPGIWTLSWDFVLGLDFVLEASCEERANGKAFRASLGGLKGCRRGLTLQEDRTPGSRQRGSEAGQWHCPWAWWYVKGTGTGLGPSEEKILRNATTYKLFPRTLLFEAPRCRISSGSEYSSPTMVGPASCKVSHSSCSTGCQVGVEGLASPSSLASWP